MLQPIRQLNDTQYSTAAKIIGSDLDCLGLGLASATAFVPWACYLMFPLCLSFLICKMGMILTELTSE